MNELSVFSKQLSKKYNIVIKVAKLIADGRVRIPREKVVF